MRRLFRRLLLSLTLLLAAAGTARADSLAQLRRAALPALPAGAAVQALAVVDGQAAALGADGAWLLAPQATQWQRRPWAPPLPVLAAVSQGGQAFVLLGRDGQAQQAARLLLPAAGPALQPLPALPAPLRQARLAATADRLWLAGLDAAGRATLLQLALDDAAAAWRAQPGWPGDAPPLALLAQNRALYVVQPGAAPSQPQRLLRWAADGGWQPLPPRADLPCLLVAGAVRASGQAHALFAIQPANEKAPRLMSWQTITQAWAPLPDGAMPGLVQAAAHGDGWLWLDAAGAAQTLEIESGKLLRKR